METRSDKTRRAEPASAPAGGAAPGAPSRDGNGRAADDDGQGPDTGRRRVPWPARKGKYALGQPVPGLPAAPPSGRLEAGPEQLRYAAVLEKGMLLGLVLLLVTYFIYVAGLLGPYVPLGHLPQYWGDEVGRYLHEADIHTGWSWVHLVGHGDFLNFVGIALLAGVSIFCYLGILPILWRRGDRVYFVLALAQILVLCVAASGLLGSGGGH